MERRYKGGGKVHYVEAGYQWQTNEKYALSQSSSQAFRMTYVGVPLVAGGLLIKSEDDHFRSLRNDYLPRFNRHADDYLQYLPVAAMLGMKLGGMEDEAPGSGCWYRMLFRLC